MMRPSVLMAAAFAALSALCQAQSYLITTVAGGGVPFTPAPATSISLAAGSVAAGAHGNVYFIAFDCVFKMDAVGIVTRVAGTSQGYAGDGGLATNAQLNGPFGVAVDGSGNVFIADTGNYVVRKVAAATGIITTVAGTKVAGNGSPGYSGDGGPATSAGLSDPNAVAVYGFGNLYIADNYLIRKVAAATGIITTVAGNHAAGYTGDGGPATAAALGVIIGVAVDGSSNFYILSPNSNAIRKVAAATGIITTVAGDYAAGYSGDGGPATSAQIVATGLAVDGSGDIYIADDKDNVIRKVAAAAGVITTVAGNGAAGYSGDGGPATSAKLDQPYAVAVDGPGNIYIADTANNVMRKVAAATGIITTVAGNGAAYYSGDGGPAINASFHSPSGMAVDGSGNLYIGDTGNDAIRKVAAATGIVTTVAGNGAAGYSGDGGPASSAGLSGPQGVAVDGSGNLFVADTGNAVMRKVAEATGIITTVAGNGTAGYAGNGGAAIKAKLSGPSGVAVDGAGNVYIADTQNNAIRKVVAATGIITTVAGNGAAGYSGDGGPATKAELYSPMSVAVDGSGNLYIVDWQNEVIRKVAAATDIITTVAGNRAEGYSGDGGPATSAELRLPNNLAVDGSGNVYIADSGNARIRMLVPEASHALLIVTKTHTDRKSCGRTGPTHSVPPT